MGRKSYGELVKKKKKRLARLEVKLSELPENKVTPTEKLVTPVSIEHTELSREPEEATVHSTRQIQREESSSAEEPANTFHILADKKALLKQEIKAYVRQGKRPTAAIKKHFVDELKKCSKASFYRYVKELKHDQSITVIKIGQIEYCTLLEK